MPKIPSWCQIVIVEGAQVLLTRGYDDDEQTEVMRTRFHAPDFFGPDTAIAEVAFSTHAHMGEGFTAELWQQYCEPERVRKQILLLVAKLSAKLEVYH